MITLNMGEKLIDPTEDKIFMRGKVLKEKTSDDQPVQLINSMNQWAGGIFTFLLNFYQKNAICNNNCLIPPYM